MKAEHRPQGGVRYCGGCNPRYDRVAAVRELAELCPEWELVHAQPEGRYAASLVLTGCPARCVKMDDLAEAGEIIPVNGWEDLPRARERLARVLERGQGRNVAAEDKTLQHNQGVNGMDWKDYYNDHLTTAEEAVSRIKSGDRVVVGHACGEPAYLLEKLVENAQAYENVEIVHMVAMGKAAYCAPGMEKHFRHNALFVGGTSREAVASGRGDFTPCFFSEIPRLFHTTLPVDVALVQVAPPDEKGNVSLGVSVDYTREAIRAAKLVIAQVNPQMPFTYGGAVLPVTELDLLVEQDCPLIELAPPKIGEVEKAIGEHCAALVEDGDTLQLGIGAIPDAVLLFLKGKRDLGIHSEMFSDGVVELAEAGVITNAKKTLKPGKFEAAFLMGTKRLYDFVNKNPNVEMDPVDYVNDPRVIAQNDNLVSINSCVQVDLMGQVVSESVGPKQISGVGGQVDFVRGASWSKGGRSIIAMPSTAARGTVSKIVPLLDEGAAVTTSRNDVDYVITEYGVAHLRGETLRQRARNLIAIAHPDFRAGLKEEFQNRFHCEY